MGEAKDLSGGQERDSSIAEGPSGENFQDNKKDEYFCELGRVDLEDGLEAKNYSEENESGSEYYTAISSDEEGSTGQFRVTSEFSMREANDERTKLKNGLVKLMSERVLPVITSRCI